MNDALAVCCVERIGNLDSQIQHMFKRNRLAADTVFQGLAIQKFHGHERFPLHLADIVNRADVRVTESRSSAGFAAEPLQSPRIVYNVLRQKLQSDETTEPSVFGLVHHTHAAPTEPFEDAAVGDDLTDEGVGLRHCAAILDCECRQVNESAGHESAGV